MKLWETAQSIFILNNMHTILTILLSEYVFYSILALFALVSSANFYTNDKASGFSVLLALIILTLLGINYYTVFTLTQVLIAIPVYLILGVVWSILKWKTFIKKKITAYNEAIVELSKDEATHLEQSNSGRTSFDKTYYDRQRDTCLTALKRETNASYQKERIKSWIGFWPISLLVCCTYDVVDNIYAWCSGIYNNIMKSAFASANIPES